ncbi:phospholipase D-like domain-containing protein [Niallia sp. HCP3S3_B10]|uniref:phospholipase D-like domain-containing protein n=1 Tax=Niallia sp. HCP3S3_B10 TaxID=3438944 RepID=UPI003F8A2A7B
MSKKSYRKSKRKEDEKMPNNIEVYFTRPGRRSEIRDRLLLDLKHAKQRIYVAMAFINDNEFLEVIGKFDSQKKFIINNNANRHRIETTAYTKECVQLGGVVNGEESVNSLMHHKFVIIDETLWLGSYNATEHAAQIHWENMIRITDEQVIAQFVREFNKMFIIGSAIQQKNGESILEYTNSGHQERFNTICTECKGLEAGNSELDGIVTDDILSHFNFSLVHKLISIDTHESTEKLYFMECATKRFLSPGPSEWTIGVCELCSEVQNRNSLISVHFEKLNRRTDENGLVDTLVRRGREYRFCTKCIFDALTNYRVYNE